MNDVTTALTAAFNLTKKVIGTLQLDEDQSTQVNNLAEVLEHLRTVERALEVAPDNSALIPADIDGPVRMDRPAQMTFKMEQRLAKHVWDFCRENGCKPGQFFRLLTEKDMRLAGKAQG